MIRSRVCAVLQLRDGFRGCAVEGVRALCHVDGILSHPIVKPGGLLVWADLSDGPHMLSVTLRGYLPETVQLTASARPAALSLDLKPDPLCYRLPTSAACLTLTLRRGGAPLAEPFWLCMAGRARLKIAQDAAGPGADSLRLYCSGQAGTLPIPGVFLVADGAQSELVTLQALVDETGTLAVPLTQRHSRGRELIPAQRYLPDEGGAVRAWFREAGTVTVYAGGEVYRLTLAAGENAAQLTL